MFHVTALWLAAASYTSGAGSQVQGPAVNHFSFFPFYHRHIEVNLDVDEL